MSSKDPGFISSVWATKAGKWWIAGIIFFAVVIIFSGNRSSSRATNNQSPSFDSMDALALCQSAIKLASKDAEMANVPYVPDQGGDGFYFFAWNNTTKLARLRNGFGAEVGVTALCRVDAKSRRITSLTLDGQQLI